MKNCILLVSMLFIGFVLEAQNRSTTKILLTEAFKRKSLSEFNEPLSRLHTDYKIKYLENKPDSTCIIGIKCKGLKTNKLYLSLYSDSNTISTKRFDGNFTKERFELPHQNFNKIKIATQEEDLFENNNSIRRHGLFKQLEPIKLQILHAKNSPDFTQIYITPALGWNYHDKLMGGIAFHHNPLANNRFKYLFMPLYSSEQKSLVGNLNFSYTLFPDIQFLENMELGVHGKKYTYENFELIVDSYNINESFENTYTKLAPELKFNFSSKNTEIKHSLKLRNVQINKQVAEIHREVIGFSVTQEERSYYMNTLDYIFINTRKENPNSFLLQFEQNNQIVKSSISYNYKTNYRKYEKYFFSRVFLGGFLYKKDLHEISQDYRFRLSSWAGHHDYLYDHYFIGRSATSVEGINQQAVIKDGGFKVPTAIGQTWDWLGTVNFDIPFPGKLPAGIYADFGIFTINESNVFNQPTFVYDIGARVTLLKDVITIYFPAIFAEDIKENLDLTTENYLQKVRFTLYLNQLNPLR